MIANRIFFFVLFISMWFFLTVIAVPADKNSRLERKVDSEQQEDVQKAKRRKMQLEKSMNQYSRTWKEADKHVEVGHSGRNSWMNLREKQNVEEGIARKYNLYGNILKGESHVQHGMHNIANVHTQSSKQIQTEMDDVKGKGKVSPTRAKQQTEEHYDKLLHLSTEIMKEDKNIHGQNRCKIM